MTVPIEDVKATISPEYRWRVGLFAGFCLFWTLWCFLDGFVKYPDQREHANAFLEAKETGIVGTQEWEEIAKNRGWDPDKDPGRPKTDFDIYTQFFMAAITTPLAVIWGLGFIRAGSRWIALDKDALVTSWNQRVPFHALISINKQRWKSKGIAVVRYQEGAKQRTLVLDDWKYTRKPIEQMVRIVESNLREDQILGGPPEQSPLEETTDQPVEPQEDPPDAQDSDSRWPESNN